jgi:hypothetical protein
MYGTLFLCYLRFPSPPRESVQWITTVGTHFRRALVGVINALTHVILLGAINCAVVNMSIEVLDDPVGKEMEGTVVNRDLLPFSRKPFIMLKSCSNY